MVKFIPKWCPAWWPALLCNSGSSLGPPGAGASGSRVPTSRFATRRPSPVGLAPTLPHTVSLAPVRPKGTNCPGETARARVLLSLSLRPRPSLGLCAQPAAGQSPPLPANSRRLHHRHRVSRSSPRALLARRRRHPLRIGPGASALAASRWGPAAPRQGKRGFSRPGHGPVTAKRRALCAEDTNRSSLPPPPLPLARERGARHAGSRSLPDHQAVRSAPPGLDPAWLGLSVSRAEL